MLGGDTCTRHCGFCAVNKGKPMDLDPLEPVHVAEAVKHLDLKHAVITSVNRDDLRRRRLDALGRDDLSRARDESRLQGRGADPGF